MRIGLAQIDTTVGDLDGNRALIVAASRKAADAGAELVVFCELTLPGYPPRDLLDRPAFVAANRAALDALLTELPRELAVLVGFVDARGEGAERKLYNAAALVQGGALQQVFHKRLLPTYDVFDEDRYFEPGQLPLTFEVNGVRFGVTICEDAWNDAPTPLRRVYEHNPVAASVQEGARVLINLAASPFTLQKRAGRAQMLAEIARRHRAPLVFVNALGGNDDLIFDGSSALFAADGSTLAQASSFEDDLLVVDLERGGDKRALPQSDAAAALAALTLGTRDYARKCGFRSAVVGLSGGIDSALVAAIAARALGAEQVLGVAMPTRYSSEHSKRDAAELARALGIGFRTIDIEPMFASYLAALGPELAALGPAPENDTTFENLQARIRGNTLMAISNRLGHLLLTTGNRSEVAVGYCTLYGDMAGGLAVISDLPKTFVYEVARELNRQAGRQLIPESTLTKAPSAELRPNQTDQDSLPPYDVLDAIAQRLIEGMQSVDDVIASGFDAPTVRRVASLLQLSEYKRRQMPPGLIITSKAFGPGRRYPIAQRFKF
ncbi:MAG TPA: NAD+ synthase [Polyangiales bacterium]|nr:NAD+ synthase [Polyangiales bacterium]